MALAKNSKELGTTAQGIEKHVAGVDESMQGTFEMVRFAFDQFLFTDSEDLIDGNRSSKPSSELAVQYFKGEQGEPDDSLNPKIVERKCTDKKASEVLQSVIDYENYKAIDDQLETPTPISSEGRSFVFKKIDMITSEVIEEIPEKNESLVKVVLAPMPGFLHDQDQYMNVYPKMVMRCFYHWLSEPIEFIHSCVSSSLPEHQKERFALTSFKTDLQVFENSEFCRKKTNKMASTEMAYRIYFSINAQHTEEIIAAVLESKGLGMLNDFIRRFFSGDNFVRWYFKSVFPLWLKGSPDNSREITNR